MKTDWLESVLLVLAGALLCALCIFLVYHKEIELARIQEEVPRYVDVIRKSPEIRELIRETLSEIMEDSK